MKYEYYLKEKTLQNGSKQLVEIPYKYYTRKRGVFSFSFYSSLNQKYKNTEDAQI